MEHSSSAEAFSTDVANLMMETEELRRSLIVSSGATIHQLMDWQFALERTLAALESLARLAQEDAHVDLYHHCRQRAVSVAQQTLSASFHFEEPTGEEDDNDDNNNNTIDTPPADIVRRDGQGAIARITELNLLLYHSFANKSVDEPSSSSSDDEHLQTAEDIIDAYVAYQKQVLRLRARPAVAELVEARREGKIVTPSVHEEEVSSDLRVQVHDDDEPENDQGETNERITIRHFHAPVLTVVLGEASALIHPLLQWKFSLPSPSSEEPPIVTSIRRLCRDAISTVDEQTQQLVKRVSDWYWEDRSIEEWMKKSAEMGEGIGDHSHTDRDRLQRELSILDGLVEEMAFSCQLLARYENLMEPLVDELATKSRLQTELLPEWNWKYATLERFLAMRQWQSALENATPVRIVLGTEVQVPSVVEDAQYLSTRALERAASTRSLQAIGTVAHAVSHDVWSIEMESGVHQSLLDKRGCWSSPKKEQDGEKQDEKEKATNSGGFASALLEALDDDIAKEGPPKSPPKSGAPMSGGFLSSIVSSLDENVQLMQLDMEFCVLNGLFAASASCRSLVAFLDSLLSEDESSLLPASDNDKSTTMIQLAREELFRFEKGYQATLKTKISESLENWCGRGNHEDACPPNFRGKALNHLRYFLENENYQLDPASFAKLEADERLECDFLGHLNESIFLKSLGNKCDADVIFMLAEKLSTVLVEIFSQSIWESESMFTDCGSLLLSKQFRMIQSFVTKVTKPPNEGSMAPNLFQVWEPLSQIVFVLQLEKPADWLAYQSTCVLSPDDLARTMRKRIDFSPDAVQSIVAQIRRAQEGSK